MKPIEKKTLTQDETFEQCKPFILSIDDTSEGESKDWFELVNELRTKSEVTSALLQSILEDSLNSKDGFDLPSRNFLVNLSQHFFDDIYQDDKLAYNGTS